MTQGKVVAICIAPDQHVPLQSVAEVRAIADKGLEGDRYHVNKGIFSKAGKHDPGREVTLIEQEVLEAIHREQGIELAVCDPRRNIVTRGAVLRDLVDCTFQVGDVLMRGIRLSEPCGYLERLLAKPGVQAALAHRAGLRAQVLRSGTIRVGDAVQACPADSHEASEP